ncbi:hypothetical protein J5N97_007543 [Dioscorea zingiberensis]|uniref:non-specific serine/threonine protein kinase n=1 Tax=Dioscorea zingiberensis TaxID=325984 RepID=A0A9D5DFF7_9LILI|nr:hypothetical protein J5N97_007543 [Dioscorea zingiberensis]
MHPQHNTLLPFLMILFPFSCLLSSSSSQKPFLRYLNCLPKPFSCGDLHTNISYPFRLDSRHDYCGYPGFYLNCTNNNTTLTITMNGTLYVVKNLDYFNHILTILDADFSGHPCPLTYTNTTIDTSMVENYDRTQILTLHINCTSPPAHVPVPSSLMDIPCLLEETGKHSYYSLESGTVGLQAFPGDQYCASTATIPVNLAAADRLSKSPMAFSDVLQEGFTVKWIAGRGWCSLCINSGGVCGYDGNNPGDQTCYCPYGSTTGLCYSGPVKSKKKTPIIIGVVSGVAGIFMICCLWWLCSLRKRQQRSSSTLLGRASPSDPSSMKDPEYGSTHYPTHIFCYQELEEATGNFAEANELGDGGFGTVYKGILRDGRTVAVKRLYENNYKRVEQFANEILILSRLRHTNLVILYGCTSRHSRELLLVYEFVPNGTVADHLHGPRAHEGSLTWPVRMSIAIETADALAYLHAVKPQIIHRDVKTNNILLDNNFHVKVADFGLSRLFPAHVTHVSTAPQGTPGYVDPEYHQCYQLTEKSDVYSFGVVLVELISSKPAVDITRHRHEINLANMAINKIQNSELDELIDPALGYETDYGVKRMITLVAELAFRCLQGDGDLRPPIREVLEVLREIERGGSKAAEDDIPMKDDAGLLKSLPPDSPDTVMDKWSSKVTTPNTSK